MQPAFVRIEENMKYIVSFVCLFLISCSNAHTKSEKKNIMKTPNNRRVLGKSNGYFQINIQGSENSDGNYILVADIVPRKEMKQAVVRWKLYIDARQPDSKRPGR